MSREDKIRHIANAAIGTIIAISEGRLEDVDSIREYAAIRAEVLQEAMMDLTCSKEGE